MIRSKYNHVLVIGNGFDLNLGLKTGYCDFVRSEEFRTLVHADNKLCKYLDEQHELNNWIDIENELKHYSNNIGNNNFKIEFRKLCLALTGYLNRLNIHDINNQSDAFKLLKDLKQQDFLILNFNYTQTVKKILLQETRVPPTEIKDRLIHMHGTADTSEIIFGVEDSANVRHTFLKKSCNANYQGNDYKNILLGASIISFFGHSLGETDSMYFDEFFQNCSYNNTGNKKINHFYYGEDDFDMLQNRLDTLTLQRVGAFKSYNQYKHINVKKE
jgi:hypothetical protein